MTLEHSIHPDIRRIAGEDTPDKKPESPQEALLRQARTRYGAFAEQYEKTINAYAGTPDVPFTMEPGGWYIDLEKIRVNADPNFFLEQGYSESESLFATFHELEHFLDMLKDPKTYKDFFARVKERTDVHKTYPKALSRFYNCLDDVLVNKCVMSRWAAGGQAKDALYPKLFASNDFRGQPRHRQLGYALLREAMLPDEPVFVDADVREAMDKWQARGGRQKALDVVTAVDARGKARLDPQDRLDRIRFTLEPIFEEFYKKDLVDRRPADGTEENPFGVDPNAKAIPDPMSPEEMDEAVQKINDRIAERKQDEFKEAMGVDQKDFEAYERDYEKVAPHVDGMSRIFDRVIQRRKSYRRVLRKPVKEGPILDPRKAATAVAEIKAGNLEPVVMLDYENREQIRNLPNELEFTLVADGSGSMDGNEKQVMQRRLGVLFTEAFAQFRERVEKEKRAGGSLTLQIRSEVRIVADKDKVLKRLSQSLTHPERVAMHKALKTFPSEEIGTSNNEPATFDAITSEQFHKERVEKLRKGILKKVIIFMTDGETDKTAIQAKIHAMQDLAGRTKEGRSNLVVAGIGFAGGISAKETYAPNGHYAPSLEEVTAKLELIIDQVLEEV